MTRTSPGVSDHFISVASLANTLIFIMQTLMILTLIKASRIKRLTVGKAKMKELNCQ